MQLGRWLLNKPQIHLLAVGLLTATMATAQPISATHDTRSGAMGGCFMPDTSKNSLYAGYRLPFQIGALAERQIGGTLSLHDRGRARLEYQHEGNADYHQQQLLLGYGLRVAKRARIDATIGYLHTGSQDAYYNGTHSLMAATAVETWPLRQWSISVAAEMVRGDGQQAWTLAAGSTFKASPQLMTAATVEYAGRWRVRGGMEYGYRRLIFLRAGIATAPMTATCGVGLIYKHLHFDIGTEAHATLGLTPSTTIRICF